MKVIIPVGGKGTRCRPLTHSKPKPFIHIAGTTPIQFIIEHMLTLHPEQIIIVHDKFNAEMFKERLPKLFPQVNFAFVLQDKQNGPADAVLQAKPYVKEGDDILINYCDTMFVKDLSCLEEFKKSYEGVIFVREVEDYQRFGVVVHKDQIMTQIIEKPDTPISKLANIGSYFFTDGWRFMQYVQRLVDEDIRVKGEYYLPEAYMMAIRDGARYRVEYIDKWLDVGKIETILSTNAELLQSGVWKGENVVIENSSIGENVSIGKSTTIRNCTITNSIIGDDCIIEGLDMKDSVIGDNVTLKKGGKAFNIGDDCLVQ